MDSNKCVMSTQGLGGRFGWLLDAPPAALADKLGFRSEFAGGSLGQGRTNFYRQERQGPRRTQRNSSRSGCVDLLLANPLTLSKGQEGSRAAKNVESDRCIPKGTEHRIDSCLIARPLRLEPLQDVVVDAQRYGRFRCQRLQTPTHHAAHDVLDIGLRVFRGRLGRHSLGPQASPISFGSH